MFIKISLALALAFAGGVASAATLVGKNVTVSLAVDGTTYGDTTVLVGAGDDGNFFGNTFFDLNGGVNGDQFVYTSTGTFCGVTCGGGTVTWTLSGLDFGTPLTAFNILQQDNGIITVGPITETSVSFSYNDGNIHPGVNIVGQFVAGGAVPEPATWALMVGGFGLVGAGLRRRRTMIAA